ncbi:hypothetical protein CRE_19438 [Caenorhabditis remanei]|uniref:Uncharacterized protein n=1 Tax=Caenorhabditis remanei TaxID=31234 RepID=E3N9Y7_CAERE|nr:hypothetical protein CRE_19438 [Caenorhabditis remanei]
MQIHKKIYSARDNFLQRDARRSYGEHRIPVSTPQTTGIEQQSCRSGLPGAVTDGLPCPIRNFGSRGDYNSFIGDFGRELQSLFPDFSLLITECPRISSQKVDFKVAVRSRRLKYRRPQSRKIRKYTAGHKYGATLIFNFFGKDNSFIGDFGRELQSSFPDFSLLVSGSLVSSWFQIQAASFIGDNKR